MARVVVIGNLALDETLAVTALPEPGASIPASVVSQDIGGKGANQAIVLARALRGEAEVRFLAAVGRDANAVRLAEGLRGEPLVAELIAKDWPSDRSVILRDASAENAILTTQDCARALEEADVAAALAAHAAGDVLVMQGNLRPEVTRAALRLAGERGMWRVLNPSPVAGCPPELLLDCDLLVVNQGEAAIFGGAESLSEGRVVVRTLGAAGAELWQDGACGLAVPGQLVEARDPTGAGDCFLGALVAAMLRGGRQVPVAGDLAFAVWAAGLTVSRLGTQNAFPSIAEFTAARAADEGGPVSRRRP